jgi:hypothetical protein
MGKLEARADSQGRVNCLLHFAGAVAAAAFVRHVPGNTAEEKVNFVFRDLLLPGYKHAARCVQILVRFHLRPRFGG